MALAQIQRLMGFSGNAVWCQRFCVVPALWCGASVVVCLSCCVGLVQVAAMGLQRLDGFRPVGAAATQLGFDKL